MRSSLALFVVFAIGAISKADTVVFSQPYTLDTAVTPLAGIYESFSLPTTATVTIVTWWGFYTEVIPQSVQPFIITFLESNNGKPGAGKYSAFVYPTWTDTGLKTNGVDELYRYDVALGYYTFTGGQTYFFTMQDLYGDINPNYGTTPDFYWSLGSGGDGKFLYTNGASANEFSRYPRISRFSSRRPMLRPRRSPQA